MRIHFKVVTGEEYTLSNEVYGGSAPLDEKKAFIQLSFLLSQVVSFTCDQGYAIAARHIVSAYVAE